MADELADGLFVGVAVHPGSCRAPAGADALSVWPTMASADCSTVVSMRWATSRLPHVFGDVVPSGQHTEHAVIDVAVDRAIEAVGTDYVLAVDMSRGLHVGWKAAISGRGPASWVRSQPHVPWDC